MSARPIRVLVTGASGFVGGALLARLTADPAFSAIGIGRRPLPELAGYRVVDLAAPDAEARLSTLRPDPARPDSALFVPDVVVHAAARSSPWGTRAEFERENVGITRTLLRWAESLPRAPRVVHLSTASVLYRARDQRGLRGDLPAREPFVSEYARSKAAAEELVRAYPGEWVVLRPRAVFGPGDSTVFPRLLAAARSGRLPRLRVPRAGPVLSDLVHIDTLVEAIVRCVTDAAPVGRTVAVVGGDPVDLQQTVFGILTRL
ncbi:MAG: NAD(P)-dependent oxidoreductase, partial [Herbiconiux sp.]|nr:NAD(P)-dependent oxidoreductase [Herbiconiux sp.]